MNVDYSKQKLIVCHLGNGASICAVNNGQSLDTSMGFTPVEGLIMGTRAGDIDMGAVTYIMDKEMIGTRSASVLFNKQSGLLGITGVSSDMREIIRTANEGNADSQLALEMFFYRVRKYIGSYVAAMGGVDALIFTGGIGENSFIVRRGICQGLEFFGIEIDDNVNNSIIGDEGVISKGKTKVMVVPTNEELVIAQDTSEIVTALVNR